MQSTPFPKRNKELTSGSVTVACIAVLTGSTWAPGGKLFRPLERSAPAHLSIGH
jgi:hypothetical protein